MEILKELLIERNRKVQEYIDKNYIVHLQYDSECVYCKCIEKCSRTICNHYYCFDCILSLSKSLQINFDENSNIFICRECFTPCLMKRKSIYPTFLDTILEYKLEVIYENQRKINNIYSPENLLPFDYAQYTNEKGESVEKTGICVIDKNGFYDKIDEDLIRKTDFDGWMYNIDWGNSLSKIYNYFRKKIVTDSHNWKNCDSIDSFVRRRVIKKITIVGIR